MDLQQRINAFSSLGNFFSEILETGNNAAATIFRQASHHNSWFTEDNIRFSLQSWSNALTQENLEKWTAAYPFSQISNPKTIAIVMAGNIPLVGLHDFISVLISGHSVLVKLSSSDKILLPFVTKKLIEIEPRFKNHIHFTEEKLENFDAVIATGSNNTARYFEYYFGKYPNIIRKNRNSVAILSGNETQEELEALSNDIFQYFGLGCRNVSKVFLPKGYDFDAFFNGMYVQKEYINNHKYINNYDYNKAVYLMSNIKLLDNEFMLLKEDQGYSSPISVVFYEYYNDQESLQKIVKEQQGSIQAIVTNMPFENAIPFGQAQHPLLWDYADGVDTLDFLLNL